MWPYPLFPEDLVTFNVEILNEKPHFLCSVYTSQYSVKTAAEY